MADHFSASLSRLEQVRPGLIVLHRRDAERYLEQARDDLRGSCVLRIRSLAAREAAALLRRVSARLGTARHGSAPASGVMRTPVPRATTACSAA